MADGVRHLSPPVVKSPAAQPREGLTAMAAASALDYRRQSDTIQRCEELN